MALRVVRLGEPRSPNEGLRIGTVRRPPRGVRKQDYARRNYYDLWLPELAPTPPLVSLVLSEPFTAPRWRKFKRGYLREMREPRAQRLIALLAALSRETNISVGCYCKDASRCHRTILGEILKEAGAEMA